MGSLDPSVERAAWCRTLRCDGRLVPLYLPLFLKCLLESFFHVLSTLRLFRELRCQERSHVWKQEKRRSDPQCTWVWVKSDLWSSPAPESISSSESPTSCTATSSTMASLTSCSSSHSSSSSFRSSARYSCSSVTSIQTEACSPPPDPLFMPFLDRRAAESFRSDRETFGGCQGDRKSQTLGYQGDWSHADTQGETCRW